MYFVLFSVEPKIDKHRIEIGCENVICGRRFCSAFLPALCAVLYQFRTTVSMRSCSMEVQSFNQIELNYSFGVSSNRSYDDDVRSRHTLACTSSLSLALALLSALFCPALFQLLSFSFSDRLFFLFECFKPPPNCVVRLFFSLTSPITWHSMVFFLVAFQ